MIDPQKTILLLLVLFSSYLLPSFAEEFRAASYDELVLEIQALREHMADHSKPDEKDRQETIRKAWESGRMIENFAADNLGDLTFKQELVKRLSADAGIDSDQLTVRMKFAREYPDGPPNTSLSWSHYKRLMNVDNRTERNRFEKEAETKGWGIRPLGEDVVRWNKFQDQIRNEALKENKIPGTGPGNTYTYRVIKMETKLALDLGFANYFSAPGIEDFRDGDWVRVAENGKLVRAQDPADFKNTYHAVINEVNDGDTVHAVIDLGFNLMTEQRLRLNGMDAPELGDPKGQEAREFLKEQILKFRGRRVLIKIGKQDKFNRYLADIWADGRYLNQEMIDRGFAVLREGPEYVFSRAEA